ncbi:MAG TPA: ribonuclease R, partial [Rhodospirillaceae bacterium]|nr:ribonuclease R [Rhodospirillaceae bacterium]
MTKNMIRKKKLKTKNPNAQRGKRPPNKKPQKKFRGRIKHKPESKEETKKARPLPETVVGIVTKERFGWSLKLTDRRDKTDYLIRGPAKAKEMAGTLVAAKLLKSTKKGREEVEITHDLGKPDDPRNISLIAIHGNDVPYLFPKEVIEEAENLKKENKWDSRLRGNDSEGTKSKTKPVTPAKAGAPFNVSTKNQTDLRDIPFVTIDGPDSQDFDDAVFAEKDGKGWHVMIAIADVAHYVRAGGALDREAYLRGNSTYFPDRVVPMLPETLSNDLCSLRPNEDRACMAVHIWLNAAGEMKRWKFVRGVMKSKARLTYEQVQAAKDGDPDETTKPLIKDVIEPLYGAYACLTKARLKRGTLELDLPERKVEIAKNGTVKSISVRERLDSHRLIEELMIAANVAAAAQLEGKSGTCLYRVHDKPTEMKLDGLRDFLDTIGISLVPARQLHPRLLTQILENVAGSDHAQIVNEVVLRAQTKATYTPDNIGHFGLALAKYAHFTSPIRRYADLIVHRGLIRACKLGDDGLTDHDSEKLEEIGEHISATER